MEDTVIKYKGTIKYNGHEKEPLFEVTADPDCLIRFKQLFPKVDEFSSAMLLSASPENCYDIEWFMQRYPLKADEKTIKFLKTQSILQQTTLFEINKLLSGEYKVTKSYPMAKPPRHYQMQADDLLHLKKAVLVADDLGTGKTVTGITSFTDANLLPALVVLEKHLTRQWIRKIKEFMPDLKVHVIKTTKLYDLPKADIYLCTYHKLSAWKDVIRTIIKFIIYEEVQNLRCNDSSKYNAAKYINETVEYKEGLSATPVYNYGDEIFNILDCMHKGCLGKRNEFLREWCSSVGNRGKYKIDNPAAFGTYLREQGLMLRRTAEELKLEIPEEQPIIQIVPYDEDILNSFKGQATELAKLILEGKFGESGKAALEFDLKLRQTTGIAKAPFVAEYCKMILENYPNLVLFAWHREVYEIYLDMLKEYNPVLFTGSESEAQKDNSVQSFLKGDSKILIISLRSGTGLDGLQEVSNVCVFGELDWSPQILQQCVGRLKRPGQTKPVMSFYLIADDGADPSMCNVLGLKLDQSEGILNLSNDNNTLFEPGIDMESRVKEMAKNYLKSTHLN